MEIPRSSGHEELAKPERVAQDRLARARDNQTEALFNYGLARIDLYAAMGTIRRMLQ
jgi:hypothetical protein